MLDPKSSALQRAAAKSLCRDTARQHHDKIRYYARRCAELGRSPAGIVIIVLNVDSDGAVAMSDRLFPGARAEWRSIAARTGAAYSVGLCERSPEIMLDVAGHDVEASAKLREMVDDIPILVADHGVFEVFRASDLNSRGGRASISA